MLSTLHLNSKSLSDFISGIHSIANFFPLPLSQDMLSQKMQ